MARTSKKPKPTFDVAHDPISDTKSGWVYRSEPLGAAEPAAIGDGAPARPEPRELYEPPLHHAAPRRVESESSWIRTGVYLMVLPVTIGMSIMFAPVTWLLGGRSRR